VVNAEDSYTQVDAGTIKVKTVTNGYTADHSMDHLLDAAKVINDLSTYNFDKAKEEAHKYPEFHSVYHAQAVVEKAALGETYDLSIVMTTHDFTMLPRYADQVALINHRIVRMDTPAELLNSQEFKDIFHMTGGVQL
jgi:hypothetical protein